VQSLLLCVTIESGDSGAFPLPVEKDDSKVLAHFSSILTLPVFRQLDIQKNKPPNFKAGF